MLAASYLADKGYTILEVNYQCHMGEIDIIARDQETLVFIEVKYRDNNVAGSPEEAVTMAKQRKISKVALYYLTAEYHRIDVNCRFDVVAIQSEQIKHYENAFYYRC